MPRGVDFRIALAAVHQAADDHAAGWSPHAHRPAMRERFSDREATA